MTQGLKKLFEIIFPHTRLNRSLRILILTNSVMVFILGLFAPFYAIFVRNIGGSIAFAGLSWGILSIVAGVLIFLFSNWELKVKEPELLIAFAHIIRGMVFISYAFMGSMTQLIITQVLWGIAIALSAPSFDSVYAAHTNKNDSISEWSGWEGLAAISSGVAALIGGLIIESFGYQSIFLGMAAISIGLGIYIWSLPRETL